MSVTNAFPNDLNEFSVDNQSGINKPIRKPLGFTLNQNRNSGVGNNQGQGSFQNVPNSRTDTQI